MKEQLFDAEFPKDSQGKTYHVGTSQGQVANRIITVGEHSRARRVAKWFDQERPIFEHESHRNFLTLTGTFQGIPISIVSIGMGISAIDFFIRECRAVIKGKMIVVRLGSCGAIANAKIGNIAIPFESIGVFRNYDAFGLDEEAGPYIITRPLACSKDLQEQLVKTISSVESINVISGKKNASTDSFYSSQGRISDAFIDRNEDLIIRLCHLHPELETFEMETFQLNHLANCVQGENVIETASVQIVFANRKTREFIDPSSVEQLESICGKSILKVLSEWK